MKRINVIGTTGSGKTTFSKELSATLTIPYIQMDELFWKPNWVESLDEEFLPKVASVVSGDAWVLDGNFSRTNSIKWQRADTLIWLDFGYVATFSQLLGRTLRRATCKNELWPNTGNKESFKKTFFSKSSILMWFFKNYGRNKKRYANLMRSNELSHVKCVRLRNRKQAREFIERARKKLNQQGT